MVGSVEKLEVERTCRRHGIPRWNANWCPGEQGHGDGVPSVASTLVGEVPTGLDVLRIPLD